MFFKKEELPFGIDYVIELDLGNVERKRASGSSFTIDCPFCGRKQKLNVNPAKGVWRCPACDESGNSIGLHAKLTDQNRKNAYRDLMDHYNGLSSQQKTEVKIARKKAQDFENKAPKPFDLETRDRCYRALEQVLNLSRKHEILLENRGLSQEQIRKNGYRSYPMVGLESIAKIVLRTAGITVTPEMHRHLPGFYDYTDQVKMTKRPSCILIPVRTMDGRISGYQLRSDKADASKRYTWLSSSEKTTGTSTSGIENIHFVGFEGEEFPKEVYLTEGPLKADVCNALIQKPFVALTGVNNQGQLDECLATLHEKGTETIVLCVDMDYRDKPEVKKALEHIVEKCKKNSLYCRMLVWPSEYKGFDDYLYARKMKEEKDA